MNLGKEFAVVPRVVYSFVFAFTGLMFIGFGSTLVLFTAFGILVLSVMWQYVVIHYVFETLIPRRRSLFLILWIPMSILLMGYHQWKIDSVDRFLDSAEMLRQISRHFTWYITGAGMFVAGACARRAYQRHDGLGM